MSEPVRDGIVVVGSLNVDLVVRVSRFPAAGETVAGSDLAIFAGGKGANQAVAAARLGGRVAMVGRVGDDDNGRRLLASLAAAGVDRSGVVVDPSAPTGVAVITIDGSGQNMIVLAPGANRRLRPEDLEGHRNVIERAAILLLQLEVPIETVEAAAQMGRAAGVRVILDPAPARPEALALLPFVDFATPNEIELRLLAGASGVDSAETSAPLLAHSLLGRGARHVIAKLGAEGALAVSTSGETFWPAHQVHAVDTTAAGDVWNGAFAVALAEGHSMKDAGAFASAAAAVSVTRAGAQPSMPIRADVPHLL